MTGVRGVPASVFAVVGVVGIASTMATGYADGPERGRDVHAGATVGWSSAATGPLSHGPAIDLEVYPAIGPPASTLAHLGAIASYRGHERLGGGLFAVGVIYEAGAARPGLVIGLHAHVGYDTSHSLPVAGAGVRAVLGVADPVALSGDVALQGFVDGVDSRLGIALTLGIGVAR